MLWVDPGVHDQPAGVQAEERKCCQPGPGLLAQVLERALALGPVRQQPGVVVAQHRLAVVLPDEPPDPDRIRALGEQVPDQHHPVRAGLPEQRLQLVCTAVDVADDEGAGHSAKYRGPVDPASLYEPLLWGWFGLAALVFVVLQLLSAPYGRHTREGWGPTIPSRVGWVLMELPAVLVPLACWLASDRRAALVPALFLGMWLAHYVHRTFIYPLRMRMDGKRMPLVVVLLAVVTNCGIDWLNFYWIFFRAPEWGTDWLTSPQFLVGFALFWGGFVLNRHSDAVLRDLRAPGETGYKIPRAGAYRWVSAPNYLGELLAWTGWAIATWSLPGLAFALWTASNLVPRAVTNHAWYRETFPDYPPERKRLIPLVW